MAGKPPSHTKQADFAGGVKYWTTQPASLDGVLGGFGHLTQVDALSSRMFLLTVCPWLSSISKPEASANGNSGSKKRKRARALDVGSGIGRVTSTVLLPLVDSVDLVEPVEHFITEAHRAADKGEWKSFKPARGDGQKKLLRFYKKGLQDFDPQTYENDNLVGTLGGEEDQDAPSTQEPGKPYDVIWCQWCLGHLSDAELAQFLEKCKSALASPGDSVIIVKENILRHGTREYDSDDHSWTRSRQLFEEIFAKAGLKVVRDELQQGFPQDLFPVYTWALR